MAPRSASVSARAATVGRAPVPAARKGPPAALGVLGCSGNGTARAHAWVAKVPEFGGRDELRRIDEFWDSFAARCPSRWYELMLRRISGRASIFRRFANVRRAPKRFDRKREPRCACGRWRRAGCRRRRGPYVTSGRRHRSRPGSRNRRVRCGFGSRAPQIARKRMFSGPCAAFRVDRSPSLCSAGRFDITELLHDDLHRLRRPECARRSPKAPRPRTGGWQPRPDATASGPRPESLRPASPCAVPTAAADRWTAAESALGRL